MILMYRVCLKRGGCLTSDVCDVQVVIVFGLLYHEPLQYNDYHYPGWAEWIGWTLAMSSILMIPLFAIIQLIKTPGTLKEVCAVCYILIVRGTINVEIITHHQYRVYVDVLDCVNRILAINSRYIL